MPPRKRPAYHHPMISVIVPVLNESVALPVFLKALREQRGTFEVIVVDGGSDDGTPDIAAGDPSVRLLRSARGRGCQMNAGAALARGDTLLFLHADTRLAPGAIDLLDGASATAWQAGAFTHSFSPTDWRLRLLSAAHNFRCRWTRVYYGDQAIFVRKTLFERVGGFPDVPMLEDVIFCERLRPLTRAVLLPQTISTDPRRFLHHGVWRSIARGVTIVVRHQLGLRVSGRGFSDPVR